MLLWSYCCTRILLNYVSRLNTTATRAGQLHFLRSISQNEPSIMSSVRRDITIVQTNRLRRN